MCKNSKSICHRVRVNFNTGTKVFKDKRRKSRQKMKYELKLTY